jgi:hypothetical protein
MNECYSSGPIKGSAEIIIVDKSLIMHALGMIQQNLVRTPLHGQAGEDENATDEGPHLTACL